MIEDFVLIFNLFISPESFLIGLHYISSIQVKSLLPIDISVVNRGIGI